MAAITIEITAHKNRQVLFPPTQEILRGKWTNVQIAGTSMHTSVAQMPDIPGIRISVDAEAKTVRRFDPLAEDAELWNRIETIMSANQGFFDKMTPWPSMIQADCDQVTIKTWLWWMSRLVQGGHATVVGGVMPSIPDILGMPGEAIIGQSNSMIGRKLTAERDSPFASQTPKRAAAK